MTMSIARYVDPKQRDQARFIRLQRFGELPIPSESAHRQMLDFAAVVALDSSAHGATVSGLVAKAYVALYELEETWVVL